MMVFAGVSQEYDTLVGCCTDGFPEALEKAVNKLKSAYAADSRKSGLLNQTKWQVQTVANPQLVRGAVSGYRAICTIHAIEIP